MDARQLFFLAMIAGRLLGTAATNAKIFVIAMRRLFSNIIQGVGSVLVLFPTPYERPVGAGTFCQSDEEALQSDWAAVGCDMSFAIQEFDRSQGAELNGAQQTREAEPACH